VALKITRPLRSAGAGIADLTQRQGRFNLEMNFEGQAYETDRYFYRRDMEQT
jgi:hypothetical protein